MFFKVHFSFNHFFIIIHSPIKPPARKHITAVPKVGVAAYFIYYYKKAPYSGAYAAAGVVGGSVPYIYYSMNDAECIFGNYSHNKSTDKFHKDKARKKQIGKTSVSYQKRFQYINPAPSEV